MTLGIIDVGTNSIHLLVGILGLNGKFHIILKERDLARLGEGGLARGKLTRQSMTRALSVLRRYRQVMRRCQVDHIEAVATSAVRDAANGRAFVRRVRSQLGVPLRMISGREEARLIYLGVLYAHRFRRPVAIITIGGGSAQVICGDGARLRYVTSVPLGGARLAQPFIRHDPARLDEVQRLTRYVQRTWAPVAKALRRHHWGQTFGSSATIYQLMLAAYLRTHRKASRVKRRLSMSRRALQQLVVWLARSTAAQRLQLEGLDPRREDLALATGVALLGWMEACRITMLRYAPGSLREGLVIDYLIRHRQGRIPQRLADPLEELFGLNGHRELAVPQWRRRVVQGRSPVKR